MKKLLSILVLLILVAGSASAANRWFVNAAFGDDSYDGLTPTTAKKSITAVIATGLLADHDTINIAAGTYSDHPTISKGIVINGYKLGPNTDILFDCTAASINFTMSGTTKFALNDIPEFGLPGAGRFYFYGTDNTGLNFTSGNVELLTATFQFEAPFMIQQPFPAQPYQPSAWFVDGAVGDDDNGGLTRNDPKKSISGVEKTTQWLDGDVINMATAIYKDGPVITKNVSINGYIANGYSDVMFDLDSATIVFQTSGRVDFTSYAISGTQGAQRFYFYGSSTTGIQFKTGCVHSTPPAILYFLPPFRFESPVGSTGISAGETVPDGFALGQSYPNPFNPSAVIPFSIGTASYTTLKIFDVSGREVATLVDEMLQPGSYEKTFDAKALSSGVYFYRLQSAGLRASKKVLLVK